MSREWVPQEKEWGKEKPLRAAVVGCGSIARVHGESLKRLPGVPPVGFADIRPERAQELAMLYGGRAYSSLEEMLDGEQPDVLHICTPHVLHTPMARQAVEQGIAVFTEKPPVISREQWEAFSALEETGVPIGVCFQNRYNPSVEYIRQLLETKKWGKILGCRAFVTWRRDSAYYTESGWRGQLETEGGGVLINQSIHTLDLILQFLGRPSWVEASLSNHHLKQVIQVEDTMEAYLDFQGVPACFYATTSFCTDSPVWLELVCQKGTLRMEETRVTLLPAEGERQELEFPHKAVLGKPYWGSGHELCIADFYASLREGRKFRNAPCKVKDTVETMLALYASAREGGVRRLNEEKAL